MKVLSQSAREAIAKPAPTGQLEPAHQPFQGIPAPTQKIGRRAPVAALPAAPVVPVLRHIQQAAHPRRPLAIPLHREGEMTPIMRTYQAKQQAITSDSPYLINNPLYVPQTRKGFYRFIEDTYSSQFQLKVQAHGRRQIDEDACNKLSQADSDVVEAFLYQKFIREYIRMAGPYRGILVYHGLGSGKTCSAIAAAEAIYGSSNKKMIVMTPFSLRANFMSEISFCGFRHFHTKNHWIEEPLGAPGSITELFATSVLSLRDSFLKKIRQRPLEQQVIWIPDFEQKSNYDELGPAIQTHIREQLTEMIDSRITFISYNGITASKLKQYACEVDPQTGERMFDNAIIVIDEVHNLTRLMQGNITPYIEKRKGRARKIPVEPIVPGRWKPSMCGSPINYKRAYLFYRLLTDARNSKIIGLSGTPIINFPEELGILANVLGGYIECAEFILQTSDETVIKRLRDIAEKEKRVDMVRFIPMNQSMQVLISVFLEGYERADSQEEEFVGVRYNELAQEGIREVYPRIKAQCKALSIPVGEENYVSHARLPIDDETFKEKFIDVQHLSIRGDQGNDTEANKKMRIVLQKRLTGLISYYRGSKEEYMPRVVLDKVEKCEMSDYVLSKYTVERKREIEGEVGKEKESGDAFAIVEIYAKMKNPSSYRFRSRAICNFAFPSSIQRPFPRSKQEEEEEVSEVVEVPSMEDADALAEVAQEDEMIEVQLAALPDMVDQESDKPSSAISEAIAEAPVAEAPVAKAVEEQQGGATEEEELAAAMAAAPAAPAAPAPVAPKARSSRPPIIPPKAPIVEEVVEEVIEEEQIPQVLSYKDRIKRAMTALDSISPEDQKSKFLNLDHMVPERCLSNYSTKLDKMLRNMQGTKGSHLVYSQFKTVEGLGVLAIALKANGYEEIVIEGSDDNPRFSATTIQSFQEPLSADRSQRRRRFITFTGEGSKDRRNLILNVFNGNMTKLPASMAAALSTNYSDIQNKYGDICRIIGITGAGAEGISLKCCRYVHIMEPYWNMVRLEQVKGRAIRICSHKDLPYDQRDVEIFTYYTVFSEKQLQNQEIDFSLSQNDNNETSDQKVWNVSQRKNEINQSILKVMKESAVDCQLNGGDNLDEKGQAVQCVYFEGRPDQYLYDPDIVVDESITTTEIIEAEPVSRVVEQPSLGPKAVYEVSKKGTPYRLVMKDGSNDSIFNVFAGDDMNQQKKIGEWGCDPVLFRQAESEFHDQERNIIASLRGYVLHLF